MRITNKQLKVRYYVLYLLVSEESGKASIGKLFLFSNFNGKWASMLCFNLKPFFFKVPLLFLLKYQFKNFLLCYSSRTISEHDGDHLVNVYFRFDLASCLVMESKLAFTYCVWHPAFSLLRFEIFLYFFSFRTPITSCPCKIGAHW